MKGFLSFLVLWLIRKGKATGAEIASELEKRKGSRPSPGTIYPVLKYLKEKNLVKSDDEKKYSLTRQGEEELQDLISSFLNTFSDMDEMKKCRYISKSRR